MNQLLPLRIISNQRDLPDSKLDPPLKFQTSRSGRAGLCIGADFPFANEDNRDVVRARRQHPYGQALQYPALGEGTGSIDRPEERGSLAIALGERILQIRTNS